MLNPYHLRPYIGHDVRIETALSIVEGTLTDVDFLRRVRSLPTQNRTRGRHRTFFRPARKQRRSL